MYCKEDDGRLQVTAAASLLDFSRLVQWDRESQTFVEVPLDTFEYCWKVSVDPVFGRWMCWINFATGAETLAKGVCLLNNIEIRKSKPVPEYPTCLEGWAESFRRKDKNLQKVQVTNFGTLGNLYKVNEQKASPLLELCTRRNACTEDTDMLLAAYELLGTSIRNRDAHAYVPDVRREHYYLVPKLFVKCFNLLLGWLPEGAKQLNEWRDQAPEFIASLAQGAGARRCLDGTTGT